MGRYSLKGDKSKTEHRVVKKCPECEKDIPVACKTCPLCKAQVTPARLFKLEDDSKDISSKIRRTERIRRERPDFFNSLEVDNKFKKKRKRKESVASIASPTTPKPRLGSTESICTSPNTDIPKKRRGRPKSIAQLEVQEKAAVVPESKTPPEEDYCANLPPEKFLQYTVILSEINRKFSTQNFKPL